MKGKSEPLAIWRAAGTAGPVRGRRPDRTEVPFVGRDHELNLLQDLFARVVRERAASS